MVCVIQIYMAGRGAFDPTWYAPTAAALACLEVHLATMCAALPIFWPVLERKWNHINVTYTVSVAQEEGCLSMHMNEEVKLQSVSSDREPFEEQVDPGGWQPFVGDETTGLGKNVTLVESGGPMVRHVTAKRVFSSLKA